MKLTRFWGAASLALAAASPALASGSVVAQMDARISNLQATFTDFRPDDGIDAGITWNSTYGGSATVICCRGFGGSTDTIDLTRHMSFNELTPFDAIPTGLTMKQGNVAALSMQGGVQAKVSLDQSFFDDAVIAKGTETSNSARAYADVHGTTFVLGLKPGTEVRLSAEISIDGLLDLTKQSTYGVASQNISVYLNGSTYLGVSDAYGSADIEFLLQPPVDARFTSYSFNVEMVNGQVQPEDPTEVHKHKTFEYVIRNNGTQERWLQVGGSAQMNFNAYSNKSAVSPVPEPEGWGLAAIGLLVLGGLHRRQRRLNARMLSITAWVGAALLPLSAQAAPIVTAQGTFLAQDAEGSSFGGFNLTQSGDFYAGSNGLDDSLTSQEVASAGATASYGQGRNITLRVGAKPSVWTDDQLHAKAELEWTDVIVNDRSATQSAWLTFNLPQFSWRVAGNSSFRASIWMEGSDQPVWFSALTANATASGVPQLVWEGKSLGMQGDPAYMTSYPSNASVFLGLLTPGQSGKVHFKIEMGVNELGGNYNFAAYAVGLNLAAVPEPSTWAMGLAGLALIGVFARRRQAA